MGGTIFKLCLKVYCIVSHNVFVYEKNPSQK